jgi:hypothetical protein
VKSDHIKSQTIQIKKGLKDANRTQKKTQRSLANRSVEVYPGGSGSVSGIVGLRRRQCRVGVGIGTAVSVGGPGRASDD